MSNLMMPGSTSVLLSMSLERHGLMCHLLLVVSRDVNSNIRSFSNIVSHSAYCAPYIVCCVSRYGYRESSIRRPLSINLPPAISNEPLVWKSIFVISPPSLIFPPPPFGTLELVISPSYSVLRKSTSCDPSVFFLNKNVTGYTQCRFNDA